MICARVTPLTSGMCKYLINICWFSGRSPSRSTQEPFPWYLEKLEINVSMIHKHRANAKAVRQPVTYLELCSQAQTALSLLVRGMTAHLSLSQGIGNCSVMAGALLGDPEQMVQCVV